jgi:hypothetical protein
MTVRVPRFSRLRFGELVSVDGVEFWDVLDLPEIPEQPDDQLYTVLGTDRIDLLAYRLYKDARLWWVIAVANGMEDIPTDFNEGEVIRLPSPRYVLQVLFNTANISAGA